MAIKYTEEQLNSVDKSMLIQMFLNQQEQLGKSQCRFVPDHKADPGDLPGGKENYKVTFIQKKDLFSVRWLVKPLVDVFICVPRNNNEIEVGNGKLEGSLSIYVN